VGAAITAHGIPVGFAGQDIPEPDLGPIQCFVAITFFYTPHEMVVSKSDFCVRWSDWLAPPATRFHRSRDIRHPSPADPTIMISPVQALKRLYKPRCNKQMHPVSEHPKPPYYYLSSLSKWAHSNAPSSTAPLPSNITALTPIWISFTSI